MSSRWNISLPAEDRVQLPFFADVPMYCDIGVPPTGVNVTHRGLLCEQLKVFMLHVKSPLSNKPMVQAGGKIANVPS
jgi:hypothetical protein